MKSVKYHNYTEKEALEYTSKLVDFGVMLIVYAALNELLNAFLMLRNSRHFCHTVKRRAKEALKQRNRKVEELKNLVIYKGFAETYWDAIIDACEEDVAHLRSEIKWTLEQANVEEPDFYSEMETSRVMIEAAKIHFEEVIKDCNNKFLTKDIDGMKNLNLFDTFREFYIDGIFKEWQIVCDLLYKNKYKDIDLSNERTIAAFDVMADKFARGLYTDQCLKEAQKEYPEFSDAKIVIEED